MHQARIGIIGGSGLYQFEGFELSEEVALETPFGDPSDHFFLGHFEGHPIAFLPRHGRGHRWLPSQLPHRANLHGFKQLGVEWLVGVGAVGSLQTQHQPGNVVLPDQFFDRTHGSTPQTFFGDGIVAHVGLSEPVSAKLAGLLHEAAVAIGHQVTQGGVYVNMNGPAFSTKAESIWYHQAGFDIIGMTNMIEAKLAREAEIAYASLAMVTDYDSWNPEADHVSVEMVIKILKQNTETAQKILHHAIPHIAKLQEDPAHRALEGAILTSQEYWPEETAEKLDIFLRKYRV